MKIKSLTWNKFQSVVSKIRKTNKDLDDIIKFVGWKCYCRMAYRHCLFPIRFYKITSGKYKL